jgi:hypothetical protein
MGCPSIQMFKLCPSQLTTHISKKTHSTSTTHISSAMTERRPSGHGLDDEAVREAHDFIHKAEQKVHEHDAEMKRGLSDSAVEAEHEFEDMVERGNEQVYGISDLLLCLPRLLLIDCRSLQNHSVTRLNRH